MTKDPVPLKAVHHLEFWVGNAKQAAYFYRTAFGFNQIAYSGLETGNREKASYVLAQGRVRLVFSTPLGGNNGISSHIKQHGDGVKDIAFHVDAVSTISRKLESISPLSLRLCCSLSRSRRFRKLSKSATTLKNFSL